MNYGRETQNLPRKSSVAIRTIVLHWFVIDFHSKSPFELMFYQSFIDFQSGSASKPMILIVFSSWFPKRITAKIINLQYCMEFQRGSPLKTIDFHQIALISKAAHHSNHWFCIFDLVSKAGHHRAYLHAYDNFRCFDTVDFDWSTKRVTIQTNEFHRLPIDFRSGSPFKLVIFIDTRNKTSFKRLGFVYLSLMPKAGHHASHWISLFP